MQTEMLYGNGLKTKYSYDTRNQLTGIIAGVEGKPSIFEAKYSYNGNGNRITKDEQLSSMFNTHMASLHTEYSYDCMNRLIGESLNGNLTSYSYDLAGNRLTKTSSGKTQSYLYNSRNQLTELISEDKKICYSYDNAGSLVEEKHYTPDGEQTNSLAYSYDVYNRNILVEGADFTQKNHYDAEGYRYAIEENGKVTNFAYRGGMLLSELDEEKNCNKGYIFGNEYVGMWESGEVSTISSNNNNSTSYSYYFTDEQGSIRFTLNETADVENYYQYSAFGENLVKEEKVSNRLRYNAQIEDDLTGLYYLRARYYNPMTGRFTQEDVIYNDGLNLYAYCNSNPVMYCDPSGFAKKSCDIKPGDGGKSTIDNYMEGMVDSKGKINSKKMRKLRSEIQKGKFSKDDISTISKKMSDLGITKEYEDAMKKIKFGKYLKNISGDSPADMINPHAHHILFKTGNGPAQQALVEEGQNILRKYGIDPVVGPENLIWAPNAVTGQHSVEALENVVETLRKVDKSGGDYDDIVEALRRLGIVASQKK